MQAKEVRAQLRIAREALEKALASLEPELMAGPDARAVTDDFAQVTKLGQCGLTRMATTAPDAGAMATIAGTSLGTAKRMVDAGRVMTSSPDLAAAMQAGEVSLDQAAVIAPAIASAPAATENLLKVAREDGFHVLRDKARAVKLEAEQHGDLFTRQREARSARTWTDELGMGHINLVLEPLDYARISNRAEAEAQRLARADKSDAGSDEGPEPFERYLADAYVAMLSAPGTVKGRAKRPELVVVMSEGVAMRGYQDVRPGEVCKIPGVGPISPGEAKELARDAIVNVVTTDGIRLKDFKRYSRHRTPELQVLLDAGDPPDFDGVKCVDCGNRFRNEFDHVEPRAALGPTSPDNMRPRCYPCHRAKTERDRKAGKLRPPPEPPPGGPDP